MFEGLQRNLGEALKRLRGRGRITESNIREGIAEVRKALLDADVNYNVVQAFIERVTQRSLGQAVLRTIDPSEQIVKIVYDELVALMGPVDTRIRFAKDRPTVLMLCGLQGQGKTTTAAKLARRLKGEGKATRLVAADVYRPAAIDQLETLGRDLQVPVFADRSTTDVVRIARQGIDEAKRERDRVVILDTAGRLQIDESMMDELRRLKDAVQPDEILLVADGMTGQDAVRIAQGFNDALGVTGVVLTKMDGDARGGAALSIYGVTRKPIKYIGVGEKTDALEEFHPDRMAGRILQQGDVLTLVEKAQQTFDADEAKRMEKKIRKEGMDLQDFLSAMKQMEKLGSMQSILKMLPGVNSKMMAAANKVDPKRMRHLEAIVLSMTPEERRDPVILNGSRRARVAKGSGRPVSEVNRLLEQFREMQKMMKKVAAGGRRPF